MIHALHTKRHEDIALRAVSRMVSLTGSSFQQEQFVSG